MTELVERRQVRELMSEIGRYGAGVVSQPSIIADQARPG